MINFNKKTCIEQHCDTSASFNYLGESKGIYCSTHKKKDMINMYQKICLYANCKLVASFGKKGGTLYEYCTEHKLPGMIALYKYTCKHKDCEIQPCYGFPDGKQEYCEKHHLHNQINLKLQRCNYNGCDKTAAHNFPGEKALTCATHADIGMIDIYARRCDNCDTTATFGIPGNLPSRCSQHILSNMISNPSKKCTNCKEPALYGTTTHLHCEEHKEPKEYNLVEKTCSSCNLIIIVNSKSLCGYCDSTMIKSFRLVKQEEIKQLLDNKDFEYTHYDKIIDAKCGRERPDFVFDCIDHFVVLEVDENQHNIPNYKPTPKSKLAKTKTKFDCETTRMINISQALGMKTIFIRYNPDSYKVNGKFQKTSNSTRHNQLCEYLQYMIDQKYQDIDFLSVMHLYFNEYDKYDIQLKTIISNDTMDTLVDFKID